MRRGSPAVPMRRSTSRSPAARAAPRSISTAASWKYAVSDSIDVFFDLLGGHIESNGTQLVSGASMSGPWSATVFRENAYIPAAVRATMVTENRQSVLISKGGSYPGELDIYTTSESRERIRHELVPRPDSSGR